MTIATIRNALPAFFRARRGATALEYALIVACLVVVIIVAVDYVGEESSANFNTIANSMDDAVN